MAYDVKVRDMLNQKGISGNRVGYDPKSGSVMVDNKPFMRPEKNYNGTTYTSADSFNNAYNQFTKPQNKPVTATMTQPGTQPTKFGPKSGFSPVPVMPKTPVQPSFQPTFSKSAAPSYESVLDSIMEMSHNQKPIDPYSTDAYRAAEAQSQRAQQAQTRAAQEAYGMAGAGRSVNLGERVAGIAGDQQEYLMTQVLPQIVAQEQAQRQQQLQNQYGILDALMNQENLAINRAGLTGTYISPEMQNAYNEVLSLKQAWDTAAPEQRAAIEARANEVRGQIAAMGGDPSLVGADVTLDQARGSQPRFGIQTQQAQQQQFNQGLQTRQQDLSEVQIMAALTGYLPNGTPTSAEQQRQLQNEWMVAQQTGRITPVLAQLYGLPENTPTFEAQQAAIDNAMQRQQIGISQQNANTNAAQLDLSREKFEFDKSQPSEIDVPTGDLSANTFLNSVRDMYMEPVMQNGFPVQGQSQITQDPAKRQQMFWQVVDAGYDNATTDQVLRALGFTLDEINKYAGQ